MIDDGTLFRHGPDQFRWIGGDDYGGIWLKEQAKALGLDVQSSPPPTRSTTSRSRARARARSCGTIVWTPPGRPSVDELGWFRFTVGRIGGYQGIPIVLSRTGYTGELGFEVFCHPKDGPAVWDAVMQAGEPFGIAPMGLAALDMVRIEAGLVFAGYEFDSTTDPFEAGIGFAVAPEGRGLDRPGGAGPPQGAPEGAAGRPRAGEQRGHRQGRPGLRRPRADRSCHQRHPLAGPEEEPGSGPARRRSRRSRRRGRDRQARRAAEATAGDGGAVPVLRSGKDPRPGMRPTRPRFPPPYRARCSAHHPAQRHASQPDRCLSHVPVLGGERRRQFLAPDPSRASGALGRRHAVHRGNGGRVDRPDHPGCLGLWDDATEAALVPVLAAIRRHSQIKVTMQIAHAGRKASSASPWEGGQLIPIEEGGWVPEAPSAVPQKEGEPAPRALDGHGLARIRDAFAATAQAGGAARDRRSGGPCGARLPAARVPLADRQPPHRRLWRLTRESVALSPRGLRRRARSVPGRPARGRAGLGHRLGRRWLGRRSRRSPSLEELKQRGADWIDVSSGGVSPAQRIALGPGYQVPFAQAIKAATGVTTIAVGLITEPQQAEEIVASARPIWSPWRAACSTTRAGPGTPRPSSAPRSRRRRNTGARSPRSTRRCSGRRGSAGVRRTGPCRRGIAPWLFAFARD